MNDKFMDDGGSEDYEYAEMQLILTKVIKIPPKTGENHSTGITGECAYIDGQISDLYNSLHMKIDKMTAGTYIVFYTGNFRKEQLCRKMNTILYCPHEVKIKRISAKRFGTGFLNDLERRNIKRSFAEFYK